MNLGRLPRLRGGRRMTRAVALAASCAVLAFAPLTSRGVPQAAAATPHEAAPLPALTPPDGYQTFPAAFAAALPDPDASPPGVNDFSCRPGEQHPRPVVLVHGTWENAYDNWNKLAPILKRDGYCVFAPDLGAPAGDMFKARDAIPLTARQLADYVDQVLRETGARQVDLVGHSQGGGVLPRWYLKYDGGTDPEHPEDNKVHQLIGISPSNHGTTVNGLAVLARQLHILDPVAKLGGQSLADQVVGSQVNEELDAGGDTQPGVAYTTIVTRFDEVVTPYDHQYLHPTPLSGPVDNITLQDLCGLDLVDHIGSSYDPIALRLVENALDPATARTPVCRPVPPVFG